MASWLVLELVAQRMDCLTLIRTMAATGLSRVCVRPRFKRDSAVLRETAKLLNTGVPVLAVRGSTEFVLMATAGTQVSGSFYRCPDVVLPRRHDPDFFAMKQLALMKISAALEHSHMGHWVIEKHRHQGVSATRLYVYQDGAVRTDTEVWERAQLCLYTALHMLKDSRANHGSPGTS